MKAPPILYHYCSSAAFHAIVQSRSIRLSSLPMSNDSSEGQLVGGVLRELAAKAPIDDNAREDLLNLFWRLASDFHGLGFCLSEKSDLLSQWRGYADDGSGLAIGFNSAYLANCENGFPNAPPNAFKYLLRKVGYKARQYADEIGPLFSNMEQLLADGALGTYTDAESKHFIEKPESSGNVLEELDKMSEKTMHLVRELAKLLPGVFVLKHDAFEEEQEWRLLTHLYAGRSMDCSFLAKADQIVPFRTINLNVLGDPAIVDVVIGPKHRTPLEVVGKFLFDSGFKDFVLRKSVAPYR